MEWIFLAPFAQWLVLLTAAIFFWREGGEARILACIYGVGVVVAPLIGLFFWQYDDWRP